MLSLKRRLNLSCAAHCVSVHWLRSCSALDTPKSPEPVVAAAGLILTGHQRFRNFNVNPQWHWTPWSMLSSVEHYLDSLSVVWQSSPFLRVHLSTSHLACEHWLTPEEKQRNSHSTSTRFKYCHRDPIVSTIYSSSLSGFFPPLSQSTCITDPFWLLYPRLSAPHPRPMRWRPPRRLLLAQDKKSEEMAKQMIADHSCRRVTVSDSLLKYEKMPMTPRAPASVVSNPLSTSQRLVQWEIEADRIELYRSKGCGVIPGNVGVSFHGRPLKSTLRSWIWKLSPNYIHLS